MLVAIILAAGSSSRMRRPKALLPVGNETFVVRCCRTMTSAGIPDVIVVRAPSLDGVEDSLAAAGVRARVVENPDPVAGQLSSLLVGLRIADRPGVQGVIVNLVDVPLVASRTVAAVSGAFFRTGAPIVRPVAADGRHGHPVIFSRAVFDELRRADPAEGAKAVLRAHAEQVLDVAVDDAGAFADIDTPADYSRLIGSASGT